MPDTENATLIDEPLLQVRNVTKTFSRGPEEVVALREVSFDLHSGEMVAVVGPSGSGKTTLLMVLIGWEEQTQGLIDWFGAGSASRKERALPWSQLSVVPQAFGLIEELSIRDNITLPARLGKRLGESERFADRLLLELGLEHLSDRFPAEISGGEQQRVALARSMISSPRLLLADEPTGHQDADSAKRVFSTLKWGTAEGACCLIATHDSDVAEYADRVLLMRDGRLTAQEEEEVDLEE
jgi:ABC-type lipoprotein export system ATPase subunit